MSKAAQQILAPPEGTGVLQAVKDGILAVAPGLGNILSDIKAEMGRLGVQGQMELASAIFGHGAFVPYGPGQYTPGVDQGVEMQPPKGVEQEHVQGGREM